MDDPYKPPEGDIEPPKEPPERDYTMIVLIAACFFGGAYKAPATTSDRFGGGLTIGFVFLCIIVAIVGWTPSGNRKG